MLNNHNHFSVQGRRATAVLRMKGARVALFLQLLVGGKKTPVTLMFEIAAVRPGNPK
jgi:hypothetical protein